MSSSSSSVSDDDDGDESSSTAATKSNRITTATGATHSSKAASGFEHATAGATAAAVAVLALHPLDVVKVRLQGTVNRKRKVSIQSLHNDFPFSQLKVLALCRVVCDTTTCETVIDNRA
jgi:hypothetical protein